MRRQRTCPFLTRTWLRPFQNCRRTRATELTESYPAHIFCAWIGKAIATFERAIVIGPAPVGFYESVRMIHVAFGEDLEALKEDDLDLYEDDMARIKVSDEHPISEPAIRGRELFFATCCFV
jgi:hypothetical protein